MKECNHEYAIAGSAEDKAGAAILYKCNKCQDTKVKYIDNYWPTQEEVEAWVEHETEQDSKDIRTLCRKCSQDMRNAGIKLKRAGGYKSECDKCYYTGFDYEVKG